jgi:isochorismate hydrolase
MIRRTTGRTTSSVGKATNQEATQALIHAARKLSTRHLPSGRFRTGLSVEGLAVEQGDLCYACPRASVFYGTSLDADLRARGVSTLVMAGISTTGIVLSSVAWASDADYDVRLVKDCCYDPDQEAHETLFRSGFGARVQVV